MAVVFRDRQGHERRVDFCERNLNLLAHAQAIELDIGSECGGHGICGKDRVRLSEAKAMRVSAPSPEEREHLSDGDLARGWRLACQCFPERTDDELECETAAELS